MPGSSRDSGPVAAQGPCRQAGDTGAFMEPGVHQGAALPDHSPRLSDQKSRPHPLSDLEVLLLRRDKGHTRDTEVKTSATSRYSGKSWQQVMSRTGRAIKSPHGALSQQPAVTMETTAVWEPRTVSGQCRVRPISVRGLEPGTKRHVCACVWTGAGRPPGKCKAVRCHEGECLSLISRWLLGRPPGSHGREAKEALV